ncbi:Uncharacterised protein [Sphingobacterium daejeonense]|nr:Uncharacterised protein [Sphingobacterium daejeonense]
MLSTQQKIQFSSYSGLYDIIVPKDNLLRKINDLIDFSFIHEELFGEVLPDQWAYSREPHQDVQVPSVKDDLHRFGC